MYTISILIHFFHYLFFPLLLLVPADVMPVTQSPLTVLEGQSITLIFTITNDDPLVQVNNIQWEFGTVDITELLMTDEQYELSDDRLSLIINHVSLSADQGIYTLSATNEAGIRSASIEIIIESKCMCVCVVSNVYSLP